MRSNVKRASSAGGMSIPGPGPSLRGRRRAVASVFHQLSRPRCQGSGTMDGPPMNRWKSLGMDFVWNECMGAACYHQTGDPPPLTWRFAVKTMPIDQSQALEILASEPRPKFKDREGREAAIDRGTGAQ